MSIFVMGLNYKTAPVDWREKLYFPLDKLSYYLQDLLTVKGVYEAVLLSTCHRSELYCHADEPSLVQAWFCEQAQTEKENIKKSLYLHEQVEMVRHAMRVACGLDSMLLGEPQVLGQLKKAFSESCASNAIGPLFHRLFQQVFSVSKLIRTTTEIGACPVSMASAAVRLAKEQIAHFAQSKIVLIGAGEMASLLMRYLMSQMDTPITILNRHPDHAAHLVTESAHQVKSLEELLPALIEAEVVFSATHSPHPVIDYAMMQMVMQQRHHRPLLLVDLAVPRDIEPAIVQLPQVQLYGVDDLKQTIEDNRQTREHAAHKAGELIQQNSHALFAELQLLEPVAHTICTYRNQMQTLCDVELFKAKEALSKGDNPYRVLELFAYTVVNKFMHVPSIKLRQAGKEGQAEFLQVAKQLFALAE